MFGFVTASLGELTEEQRQRYQAVYCGICRQIHVQSSNLSRLALRFDAVFLALLLMSLYEPEERSGNNACILHPIRKRKWANSPYIAYAADMNVALAYYNARDDWQDDKRILAKAACGVLGRQLPRIEEAYPRQCAAIKGCLEELGELERTGCENPDLPANCFGRLMAELMVVEEDMWSPALRQLGHFLGRFIYLADAAMDYQSDEKKKKYNPFVAMGKGEDWQRWEEYLVLDMANCTRYYESLPLVQDKALLDNILYSGVWVELRQKTGGSK